MTTWQKVLARIAAEIEARLGGVGRAARPHLGATDRIEIVGYRGYGSQTRCFLAGRVLEEQGLGTAAVSDSPWRNLYNTYKRLESDEIAGARVRLRFAGDEQVATTNSEGHFRAWARPVESLSRDHPWHHASLELVEPLRPGHPPVHAAAQVLVPPSSATFGVISDLDDTVVQTNATSLVRMARTVFLGNARTRLPFKGVAAFYQALHSGANQGAQNPIFYVSSSPWNLYDLLAEFLELQGIPAGPLLLRDWGIGGDSALRNRHGPHKLGAIRQILETFPHLPFLLIGDSGQEDPEIYRDVVGAFPRRILAAYIRNVTPHPERSVTIRALAAEVVEAGSSLILADNTLVAAQHAAEHGWIAASALPDIRAEKRLDEPHSAPAVSSGSGSAPAPGGAPTVVIEGDAKPPPG